MLRRPTAILMLLAILLQGALGAFSGSATICLGGGHDFDEDTPTVMVAVEAGELTGRSCSSHCDHDRAPAPVPVPVPVEKHDGPCDCTDVNLLVIELLVSPREDMANVPSVVAPFDLSTVQVLTLPTHRSPVRPKREVERPPSDGALTLIRTTRLII